MTSKTRYSHRVQCTRRRCRQRARIKRPLQEYVRVPKCPCGGSYRSIEADRRRELAKQKQCRCDAYPFPHRYGSLRFCVGHPRTDEQPTDEEFQQFEDCIRTPRSG